VFVFASSKLVVLFVYYSRRSLAPRDLTEWMRLDVAFER
jgi:hypothetical protein